MGDFSTEDHSNNMKTAVVVLAVVAFALGVPVPEADPQHPIVFLRTSSNFSVYQDPSVMERAYPFTGVYSPYIPPSRPLVVHPNGAVVPLDTPEVAIARANHLAAKHSNINNMTALIST